MRSVPAPAGFEAVVAFCDGTRSWRVSARPAGSAWWTTCGLVGHARTPEAEIDTLAAQQAANWIAVGLVK